MDMKEQAALTALRDEMRKTFEPFGARVEQLDIQLARRSLRWRARTPDYPSHHVGGAFEEWTTTSRMQHDRIVIVVLRDTALLDPANAEEHRAHQRMECTAGLRPHDRESGHRRAAGPADVDVRGSDLWMSGDLRSRGAGREGCSDAVRPA